MFIVNLLWSLWSFGRTGLGKLVYGTLVASAVSLWIVHTVESHKQREADMLRHGVSIVVKKAGEAELINEALTRDRDRMAGQISELEAKVRKAQEDARSPRDTDVVWTASDDRVLEAARVPR